jgi:D-alanyl-D-alanine carboxypeptidase/D-alanyl-D-alanine-endopeptidase (penicillin-binding protein 4)
VPLTRRRARTIRLLCLAIVAAVAAIGCRPVPVAGPRPTDAIVRLRAAIDALVGAPQFANAHFGILIVDPGSGDTLYSRDAGKLFMPASNMKILTAATALARLGPDYRFRTVLAARGAVRDGVLDGDLLVIGRGDPSVSDHVRGDAMQPLRELADSLVARGIRRVTGRVVPAGDAFPGSHFGYGWTYDDFEDAYSAGIDELLFNEGFSELHVRGGDAPGDAVRVETRPAHTVPRVRVLASTVAPRVDAAAAREPHNPLVARKDSATWDVVLEGTIAAGDSAVLEVTQHDPDAAYVAALGEALADRGIAVGGALTDTLARVDTLVTLRSPPLREILPAMLQPSQNQIAEMLFRTLALEAYGAGRTDSAASVVRQQIAAWGVPAQDAVIRDGSGLTRYDYVTPTALVRVLDAVRRSPNFSAFYDALPVAGASGTLARRMQGTPAQSNARAKTGSLALARSLSGYVTTADHRMLIFSLLCNNWTTPSAAVDRVEDAIVDRLAALGGAGAR